MAKTIDERVLEMRFENDQFESGVRQSVNSLEMLRQALRLDDATNSLQNIEQAVQGVDFSAMEQGVNQVANRFTTLGIIGDEVTRRLTNGVINLAGKIAGLIKQGGLTRAMNIEHAKFQLEGLGTAWEDVADSINYAVKGTRYGLDEAAVVASQLVASGVELGDSMSTSLRAVSGVAAMTGREYSDIGQIFTTVASNGKLMTMQLRQLSYSGLNASAALAKELGKTEEQINDMVSKGKIDFATFAQAMDNAFGEHATRANETFTGALANMKAALSRIGAEFWFPLLDGARDILNAVTPIIDAFKVGLAPVIEVFGDTVTRIATRISEALNNINVDKLGSSLKTYFGIFLNFAQGINTSTAGMSEVGRTIAGLGAAFSILGKVAQAVWAIIKNLAHALSPLGSAFLDVAAMVGDFLVFLNNALETSGALQIIFDGLSSAIGSVAHAIGDAISAFTDVISKATNVDLSPLNAFGDTVQKRFAPAQTILNGVKAAFEAIANVIRSLSPVFDKLGEMVGNAFERMGQAISSGELTKVLDFLNSGLITIMAAHFMDLGKVVEHVSTLFKRDIAPITSSFRTLRATLTAYQTSIQADTLLKVAAAIGILAASLIGLSLVDPVKLGNSFMVMTALFIELGVVIKAFTALVLTVPFTSMIKIIVLTKSLATTMVLLSVAMLMLGQLDLQQIASGLIGLGGAMLILVKGVSGLTKVEGKIAVTSASMIGLGLALNVMAMAVERLGKLDLASLAKGLGGLGVLFLELNLFLSKGNMGPMAIKTASALVIFGAALNVFAMAIERIGALDVSNIVKGLAGMGGILLEIAAFTKLAGGASGGNLIAIGASMNLIAASMMIFGQAMTSMAALSWEGIGKGLAGIAGSLLSVAAATRIMPKNMVGIGAGLILVGAALNEVAQALNSMGGMKWGELGVAMAALAGSMAILAVAMRAMTSAVPGALALTVMAAGLALLVPQLMLLSTLSLPALGVALLALAGTFAAFGIAAALLTPVVPIMIALGAAFTLLGVGIAGIGAGLTLIAAGIGGLVAVGTAGFAALGAGIKTVAEQIPVILTNIAEGMIQFGVTLAEGAPELAKAGAEMIKALLEAIRDNLPEIITLAVDAIVKLVDALVAKAPDLVNAGMKLILALLNGLRNNIGQIVTVASEIIVTFITNLRAGLGDIAAAGVELIIGLVNDMAAAIPGYASQLGEAAANLGTAIIEGVLRGLAGFAKKIGDKLMSGARSALNKVKDYLGVNSPSKRFRDEVGKPMVEGTVLGIHSMRDDVSNELVGMGKDGLKAIRKSLKINSPSIVFKEEVGRWIAEGISEGIEADDTVEDALKKKADNIVQAFSSALDRASLEADIAQLNFDIWEQLNPDVTDYQYYARQLRLLDEQAEAEARRLKYAEDELEQTIEIFGSASDEAMEAQKKMLEIKKSYLEIRQQITDLDLEIENHDIYEAQTLRDEADELAEAKLGLAKAEYELWEAANPDASEAEKLKHNLSYFDEQITRQEQKIEYLKQNLQETVADFGEASKEALEARTKYIQAQKDYYDVINDRKDAITNYTGAKLTDEEEKALSEAEQTIKDQELALEEYSRILEDLAATNRKYGFGWSLDEMEAIARKRSGYNKELLEDAKKTRDELNKKMEEGLDELTDLINDKLKAMSELFSKFGVKFASNLGEQFQNTVKGTTVPMINAALQAAQGNVLGAAGSILTGAVSSFFPGLVTDTLSSITSSSSSNSNAANKIDNSYMNSAVQSAQSANKADKYSSVVANVNVTQNNTSPTALSTSSIFRMTTSLMGTMVSAANGMASKLLSGGTSTSTGSSGSKSTSTSSSNKTYKTVTHPITGKTMQIRA